MNITTTDIALAFSRTLDNWLSELEMASVIAENGHRRAADDDSCATHDYCDANQAMMEAFETATGRGPSGSEADISLINAAWAQAKRADFNAAAIRGGCDD